MKIEFKRPISQKEDFSGNYIIFDVHGVALYSGHSANVLRRISEHRSCLRSRGEFDNGIKTSTPYSDDWYATLENCGADYDSRVGRELEIHNDMMNLLSSAGDLVPRRSELSDEARHKISKSRKGLTITNETRARMREAHMGDKNHNYGVKFSEERRVEMSKARMGDKNSNFGKPRNECVKSKISETQRNKPVVTCPWCDKVGKGSNMKRYHFDRCKERKNEV